MKTATFTPEILVATSAAVLAWLFDWFPGLAKWFDKFAAGQKRGFMAAMILIVAIIAFVINCDGVIACIWANGWDLTYLVLLAIGINQGVHLLTKPAK